MNVIRVTDYAEVSRTAADIVGEVIGAIPTAAVVVATGETPMGLYGELAHRYRAGELDTSRLRIFQLDAYVGLGSDDRRALYRWMLTSFLEPLGIAAENVVRLAGDATDPGEACRAYDRAVTRAGGIDLTILGLGPNGHLGFNEPPAEAASPTRVVALTPESIDSNARYWGGREHVPTQAMTAGMAILLSARRTLLLVSGEHKRAILHRTLYDPPSPLVPASLLRQASNVTVVADLAALPAPYSVGEGTRSNNS